MSSSSSKAAPGKGAKAKAKGGKEAPGAASYQNGPIIRDGAQQQQLADGASHLLPEGASYYIVPCVQGGASAAPAEVGLLATTYADRSP
jgi:hypothetical protein